MDLRQTDARAREAAKIADVFRKTQTFARAKEIQAQEAAALQAAE